MLFVSCSVRATHVLSWCSSANEYVVSVLLDLESEIKTLEPLYRVLLFEDMAEIINRHIQRQTHVQSFGSWIAQNKPTGAQPTCCSNNIPNAGADLAMPLA